MCKYLIKLKLMKKKNEMVTSGYKRLVQVLVYSSFLNLKQCCIILLVLKEKINHYCLLTCKHAHFKSRLPRRHEILHAESIIARSIFYLRWFARSWFETRQLPSLADITVAAGVDFSMIKFWIPSETRNFLFLR